MHILHQVQVNLIHNTNCNLFLWIEIFICTTDLYNATANRWSCHLHSMQQSGCYCISVIGAQKSVYWKDSKTITKGMFIGLPAWV